MTAQRNSSQEVGVIEWRAWEGFLLTHVLGNDSVRIEADPFKEFPAEHFNFICDSFDTVCFQINLSVRHKLPIRTRELTDRFIERGLYVVNGMVQDIRKSTLHAHLEAIGLPSLKTTPIGHVNELLFVKTNLNYGGDLERWLAPEETAAGGLDQLVAPNFGAYHYRMMTRGAIEESLWTNPAIVIEKYVANTENSFYRVYFSGERIIIVHAFSPAVIKKLSNDPRDTNYVTDLDHLKAGTDELEVNENLKRDVVRFIENTPVEFGCIDLVHDGENNYYIVDLNLTPWGGKTALDSFLLEFLRKGLSTRTQRKLTTPLSASLR